MVPYGTTDNYSTKVDDAVRSITGRPLRALPPQLSRLKKITVNNNTMDREIIHSAYYKFEIWQFSRGALWYDTLPRTSRVRSSCASNLQQTRRSAAACASESGRRTAEGARLTGHRLLFCETALVFALGNWLSMRSFAPVHQKFDANY